MDAVIRLAKLLMLTRSQMLPPVIVDRFSRNRGLPYDDMTSLMSGNPDYFDGRCGRGALHGKEVLCLNWRDSNGHKVFDQFTQRISVIKENPEGNKLSFFTYEINKISLDESPILDDKSAY